MSFYYCFDREDREVETIIAEITNTPWHERHAYVLPVSQAELEGSSWRFCFAKQFHISPFLPMDMAYDWRLSPPADRLQVHMQNWRDERAAFAATLNLTRRELSGAALARALLAFPLMTGQVTAAIYWQALRLALKRTPFFSHPRLSSTKSSIIPAEVGLVESRQPSLLARLGRWVLLGQLGSLESGQIVLRDEHGEGRFGTRDSDGGLIATVLVDHPQFFADAAFGGTVGAGEAYIRGCGVAMT